MKAFAVLVPRTGPFLLTCSPLALTKSHFFFFNCSSSHESWTAGEFDFPAALDLLPFLHEICWSQFTDAFCVWRKKRKWSS